MSASDTTPQARRVMENGGEWQARMLDVGGATCVKARQGVVVWVVDDWVSEWCELEGDELPDLNDPATCAVLWGQAEQRAETLGLTVHRSHRTGMGVWVSAESRDVMARAWEWQPEPEALARFFEWVAALEVKSGQD